MTTDLTKKGKIDPSTEQKIITAAKKIFTQQGYSSAKMRDIAQEADINLSLINYYFRSKQKLFEFIMAENIDKLFEKIEPAFNDQLTTLKQKIEVVTGHYIDLLIENPDFALFIVNELIAHPNKLPAFSNKRQLIMKSYFAKQLFALREQDKISYHPLHITMNILGMVIFPFLGRNLVSGFGIDGEGEFTQFMQERKKLIPVWLETILPD